MSSILYLLNRTLKNRLLALRRKPGMIVLYLILIAFIGVSFLGAETNRVSEATMDPAWLKLIFTAYLLLFYFTSVSKGLSSGGSFFDMCDVNFLFAAPVNSKHILAYGLLNQTGKTLLAGIFILFQGSSIGLFGFGSSALFVFLGGFVLNMILSEMLALSIYTFTNQNPARKRWVRIAAVLPLLPLAYAIFRGFLETSSLRDAAISAMQGSALYFLPVSGWTIEGIFSVLGGNPGGALLFVCLNAALFAILLVLVTLGKSDYYEDVLVATETAFSRKQAAAEGNINAMQASKRALKIRERGLWGDAAKAFFGKHLIESSRSNRLKLLDLSSLFVIGGAVVMAYMMGEENSLVIILAASMYAQTFLIGTGRGLRELYSPYIYLIPASSFSKILWSNMEVIVKSTIESVLIFLPVGWIAGAPPAAVLACILARSAFGLLLVATNLLSMRVFKDVLNKGLLLMLYFMFILAVMAPGVILAIALSYMASLAIGLLAMTLWEAGIAVLFFYFSRGVLHSCDMPTMQKRA